MVPPRPSAGEVDDAMTRLRLRADGPPWPSLRSVVRPVTLDGRRAVLKVSHEPEELAGVAALEAWAGDGAVRVLGRDGHTVVLERAGATLRSLMTDDDAATRALCIVARQLHRREASAGLRSVRSHFAALFADANPRFDAVRDIADRLMSARVRPVLLHGDLHSENVLYGSERGWLAIDPKGLTGPREFDHCTLFTNWTHQQAVGQFDARVRTVTATAGIDRAELLRWIAAWSALSGIWHSEDGQQDRAALAHAITGLALEAL